MRPPCTSHISLLKPAPSPSHRLSTGTWQPPKRRSAVSDERVPRSRSARVTPNPAPPVSLEGRVGEGLLLPLLGVGLHLCLEELPDVQAELLVRVSEVHHRPRVYAAGERSSAYGMIPGRTASVRSNTRWEMEFGIGYQKKAQADAQAQAQEDPQEDAMGPAGPRLAGCPCRGHTRAP